MHSKRVLVPENEFILSVAFSTDVLPDDEDLHISREEINTMDGLELAKHFGRITLCQPDHM